MLLIDLDRPAYTAIFISGLAHLFFFTIFTFTFPSKTPPTKPFFIFLGSILQKHDLDITKINVRTIHAQTKDLHVEETGLQFLENVKPSFSTALQVKRKKSHRTSPIRDDSLLSLEPPTEKKTFLENRPQSYEPLKLPTK